MKPSLRLLAPFLLCVATLIAASSAAAQSSDHPGLQRAIAAYQAGDFSRAIALLDSLPTSLPARDQAVRHLYRGLVLFANGQPEAARESFVRAVQIDPSVRLDAETHAPSRIRAYVAALDSMVTVWKAEAVAAEAADTVLALRYWTRVASAMPSDSVAPARIAELRSRSAPATSAPPPSALPAPDTAGREAADSTPALPLRRYEPGQAAILGVLLPGLGQIYTGRPAVGVLVLGVAGTALGVGMLHESVSVRCLTIPVNNTCPPDDVLSEEAERPYLKAGLGIAAAATLVGAIDAYFGARRANARAAAERATPTGRVGLRFEPPAVHATPGELRLALIRARF